MGAVRRRGCACRACYRRCECEEVGKRTIIEYNKQEGVQVLGRAGGGAGRGSAVWRLTHTLNPKRGGYGPEVHVILFKGGDYDV